MGSSEWNLEDTQTEKIRSEPTLPPSNGLLLPLRSLPEIRAFSIKVPSTKSSKEVDSEHCSTVFDKPNPLAAI